MSTSKHEIFIWWSICLKAILCGYLWMMGIWLTNNLCVFSYPQHQWYRGCACEEDRITVTWSAGHASSRGYAAEMVCVIPQAHEWAARVTLKILPIKHWGGFNQDIHLGWPGGETPISILAFTWQILPVRVWTQTTASLKVVPGTIFKHFLWTSSIILTSALWSSSEA